METLDSWGASAQIRSRVHSDYLLRLEGSFESETRKRDDAPLRSRQEYLAKLSPIIDLWVSLEPEIGFGILTAAEPYYYYELGEIVVRKVWIGSKAEKRLGGYRLTSGLFLTSRQSNIAAEDIPFLITRDDPPGLVFAWNAGVERTFKQKLSMRLKYKGNLYPDERGLENSFELSAGMYF